MKHRSLLVTILFLTFSVSFWAISPSFGFSGRWGINQGGRRKAYCLNESFLFAKQSNHIRSCKKWTGNLSAGYNFRFGADTKFMLLQDGIELNSGSVMIKSRNIKNTTIIKGPEAELKIAGAGTCLIEVETSGGFKVVGALVASNSNQ